MGYKNNFLLNVFNPEGNDEPHIDGVYADKIWIENDRLYLRVIKKLNSPELKYFTKEDKFGENYYSIECDLSEYSIHSEITIQVESRFSFYGGHDVLEKIGSTPIKKDPKIELYNRYERENSGKRAVYRGKETKGFIAWKELVEEIILNSDLNARIRGDFLTSIKKDLIVKPEHQKYQPIKDLLVSRGGDWKIENKQSVFNYKVKVKNNSKFVLTNIQILLTSIPSGLISQSDRYLIDILNPNSFESPTFKFSAKESCVGDKVKGVVIYTDPKGNPKTVPIQPFKIKYVCNLLVPKPISEENYEKKIPSMHEQKISFDCNLPPDELEPEISKILQHNNFYLLENRKELKSPDFRKLKAYAEGKYDKQDVALSVIMQNLAGDTNKLTIKAMSNKEEKIIDLLRDISVKCDAFKSTPEDLALLEVMCKNCESIIIVTDNMKSKDFIICEDCGEEIEN